MWFNKSASGILGINARNLLYINPYNNRASKKFADDKIFTKQFLESRNVGVAKLYQVVKANRQLTHEFFASLPPSFVIKPNRGFAGAGILVISEKKGKNWITISGKKLSEEYLYRHCEDILEGKYSISGTHDAVIFEEKLDPHPDFRSLTNVGLPDVRVIVFNMVPVMAMLRVPTPESDGKANMELGAIALGIDIGSGLTTGGAKKSKFIRKMPNGENAAGFRVPYWDEILYSVAKIQQVSKIGFLGADLVITKTGVKVLEVNARPGLKIQVANLAPLKQRLDKVKDLKVITPEEGVDIAKTLFSSKSSYDESFTPKPILGGRENVLLNSEPALSLVSRISLNDDQNYIRSGLLDKSEKLMDVTIEGRRLKLPFTVDTRKVGEDDLILSAKFLNDFYIDPGKKFVPQNLVEISTASVDEKMLRNVDEKIAELDTQIKLLSYINPRNLEEQKTLFLENPEFSPRFSYRELDLDTAQMKHDLRRIPTVDHVLFPLFKAKIKELENRLELLESRDSSDFGTFSEATFGKVSRHVYQEALKSIRLIGEVQADTSPEIDFKASQEILQDYLNKHELKHWQIKILTDSVADIQVTKRDAILLKKDVTFRENRLKALLVHEIGTHVFRFENGKVQPYRLLERGTAGYLRTEEGLAVWNQNQLGLNLGDKAITPPLLIVAIYLSQRMSFHDLFHYLKSTFELDDAMCWKLCVKAKRGLSDTSKKMAFHKDAIYFMGLRDIEKFLKKDGDIADLYVGKITVADLPLIQKISGLRPAKYLP